MELGDPSIRIALDGGDPLTTEHVVTNGDTANEHPAAFFFVIFGLVFEALATSTPDIGVQSIRTSIVALKALKYLVQNQYAGNAFRDIAIFEELVNLFYRIALTEPVSVQVHLVETLASLATSISKAQRCPISDVTFEYRSLIRLAATGKLKTTLRRLKFTACESALMS